MEEMWKPVAGYESLYEVSNAGRVFSHITNKIRKPVYNKANGYYMGGYIWEFVRKEMAI